MATGYAPPGAAKEDRLVRTVLTPEGIPLSVRLASAGTRLSALVLDLIVMGGLLILLTLFCLAMVMIFGLGPVAEIAAILWLSGSFFIRMFYFTYGELGGRGATLGKRKNGIRVAARDGRRLHADAVIARNLFREVEIFLPLIFVVAASAGDEDPLMIWGGLLWTGIMALFPLFNRDRLRVGDLLAGTWVVEQPQAELGGRLTERVRDEGAYLFTPDELDAYGEHELHVLEGILRQEGNDASIAATAEAIREKIGRDRIDPNGDRAFLFAYYQQLRAHLETSRMFGKRRLHKHDTEPSGGGTAV